MFEKKAEPTRQQNCICSRTDGRTDRVYGNNSLFCTLLYISSNDANLERLNLRKSILKFNALGRHGYFICNILTITENRKI